MNYTIRQGKKRKEIFAYKIKNGVNYIQLTKDGRFDRSRSIFLRLLVHELSNF